MAKEKAAKAASKWSQANVMPLEDVEVPAAFNINEITRLWYLFHCGPDGKFMPRGGVFGQSDLYPGPDEAMYPPAPLSRRLKLAMKVAPIVLPKYAKLLWQVAGWRILLSVASESFLSFLPVWATYSQGKLVDAVQRSLYTKEVPSDELLRLTIQSIIATNLRPLISIILSKNNQLCQEMINTATDRMNLRLHLDIDLQSASDPAVATLLKDSNTSGFRGNSTGVPYLKDLVDILQSLTSVLASFLLAFTTLKTFYDFSLSSPFSTLLFVLLSSFQTFFYDVVRRFGLLNPSPNYQAWRTSEQNATKFYNMASSFAYKQEILLFGLQEWIVDSWTHWKQSSSAFKEPINNNPAQALTVSTMPESIVKDILYLFLGLHFFSEKITLGTLHVIQSTVGTMYWQIMYITQKMEATVTSIRCISALMGAEDWRRYQTEGGERTQVYVPRVPEPGEKRGMRIEAKGLSFKYPIGRNYALRNVNLTIEAGETLAIVGFNGGGKTTLAKVLTGLYDYEGSLLLDGVEARTYKRDSLHDYMTVCPQNFAVFPLSIRENIGIGEVEDIENIPAILQAVRKGGAEDVIRLHGMDKILSGIGEPNQMGWDEPEQPAPPRNEANADSKSESKKTETEKAEPSSAVVSDKRPEGIQEEKVATEKDNKQPSQEPNGSALPDEPDQTIRTSTWKGNPWDSEIPPTISLSGGQMQRVALSRAFMRADKATLVVLDEPSSSLDARAEYELFQRIYALSKGESEETRTTIYISHRFSTVRRADKIAVVEDGAIIELGSHKELMALGGRYAEFFNLQVKAFSE